MQLLTLNRFRYVKYTTIGNLLLPNSDIFCFTLEDCVRAWGIKVENYTAIPVTIGDNYYSVEVTYSERFQKELPIIYTHKENGLHIIKNGGVEFTQVRFHGGNSIEDSSACPLTAFAYDGNERIYNPDRKNRADDALTALIKEWLKTDEVKLRVLNS